MVIFCDLNNISIWFYLHFNFILSRFFQIFCTAVCPAYPYFLQGNNLNEPQIYKTFCSYGSIFFLGLAKCLCELLLVPFIRFLFLIELNVIYRLQKVHYLLNSIVAIRELGAILKTPTHRLFYDLQPLRPKSNICLDIGRFHHQKS